MRSFIVPGLVLGLAACTLADYNTVISDIAVLDQMLSGLDNNTLALIPGVAGVPYALQIEVDSVNVDMSIITATRDANASAPFGEPGSINVAQAILNLQPMIKKTLSDVSAKNATFGDLGPIVLSSLYQLKQDTDAFGKAVVAKLASLEAGIAPTIIAQIDGYFNDAIRAYGGKAS